jgi:heme exporter protein CcmD
MKEFFDMGGYAAFVWPAYAVTFAIIVYNVVGALRALTKAEELARRRLDHRSEPA